MSEHLLVRGSPQETDDGHTEAPVERDAMIGRGPGLTLYAADDS